MRFSFDKTLSAEMPKGFTEMTAEQIRQVFPQTKAKIHGIRCKERNIVIAVFSRREIPVISAIADIDATVKNLESRTQAALKELDYQKIGDVETEIAGCRAKGIRYKYQSVKLMLGELLVTRHDKMHYTLHFFAPEDDPESLSELETVLRSIQFQ